MGFLNRLRQLVTLSDFFCSSQMLRWNNESEYKTLTGGILSIGIIITLLIAFANMIIQTLNRTSVTSNIQIDKVGDPTYSKLTIGNEFMFGVQILGLNLSSTKQYFTVNMFSQSRDNLTLETCTKNHWQAFPNIESKFDFLGMSNWLCPPLNSSYEIQGKYSSSINKYLGVEILPCLNVSNSSFVCASTEQINQIFSDNEGTFYFTIYFTNALITPNQNEYKSYYLQDQSYIIFSQQVSSQGFIPISDYQITTDDSIWPFSNFQTESGIFMNDNFVNLPFGVVPNGTLGVVLFIKSSNSIYYLRQVQKLSVVFSFIGGLIGAITSALFIVKVYTTISLEIALSLQIFKDKQQDRDSKQTIKFNFLKFIKYYAYDVFTTIGCQLEWSNMSYLKRCQTQILKQLDIKSLINRLIFIEFAIANIFEDYQLKGMQLKKPITPEDIQILRQKCDLQGSLSDGDEKDMQLQSIKQQDIQQINDNTCQIEYFQKESQMGSPSNINLDNQLNKKINRANIDNFKDIEIVDLENSLKSFKNQKLTQQLNSINKNEFKLNRQTIKKKTYIDRLKISALNGDKFSKKILSNFKQSDNPLEKKQI